MQRDRVAALQCAVPMSKKFIVQLSARLHYGRIILFTGEFYRLTERVVISMHVDATTG